MFSTWDFHGWLGSVLIVLFMGSIVVGFSMFVALLLKIILGERPTVAEGSTISHSHHEQNRQVRQAA
ncbi:hypothetical protein [Petrachloros mirabilis]